jgi:hypothetical protein
MRWASASLTEVGAFVLLLPSIRPQLAENGRGPAAAISWFKSPARKAWTEGYVVTASTQSEANPGVALLRYSE